MTEGLKQRIENESLFSNGWVSIKDFYTELDKTIAVIEKLKESKAGALGFNAPMYESGWNAALNRVLKALDSGRTTKLILNPDKLVNTISRGKKLKEKP